MFKYPISVSIDTNVLAAAKYDLSEGSTLQLLKNYVNDGVIKVVLSNIVVKESKKHLAKQASRLCGFARKLRTEALKESTEHLIKHIGLERLLEIEKDKESLIIKSEELFDSFLKEIHAEILSNDLIDLDSIIDDYFEINPPFEEGEKKRKEFPDAFIANQIRNRFDETEDVVIISNDNGFKKACQQTKNHFFFGTLGDLFDAINKEKEEAYAATTELIKELQLCINTAILEFIKSNENIDVRGLSYDKDGIEYGYDYDEFFLHNISKLSFMIHSIDEMTDKNSKVTLLCKADISADCYYEDYSNTPWDSETKDYVFVDTIKIREEHRARFGCRIEIDREIKSFKIFPFTVVLGGDSRKKRYEIEIQSTTNYEQDIQDMDRETLGFTPLGDYESYLEGSLPNSKFHSEIIEIFKMLNGLHRAFEDFCVSYDSLLENLEHSDCRKTIKSIYEKLSKSTDIPNIVDVENIDDFEIEEIKKWLNTKSENASELHDKDTLPDTLNYGETILITGIDGSTMSFSIDEIEISPTEGSEEIINIYLSHDQGEITRGYIKLLVGYLNFDEDGGASDGIDDEIEYEYFEIIERLKDYVAKQKQIVDNESEIVEIIKEFIDWYFEFKKKFSPFTNYKGLDFFFYLGNINFNYQN